MILGFTYKSLLWQGLAVAVALYTANTLATSSPTVARLVRKNGIRVAPTAASGTLV